MAASDPIKVYDARWEASEFSDAEVDRLFEATLLYARELGVDTVVLTRDARQSAGHVLELGLSRALNAGFRVFLRPEPISTPQGYFSALWVSAEHPHTMGLTVTASHNPAAYIGLKFTVPTVQAIGYECGPQGGLARVRKLYHSGESIEPRQTGALALLDLGREYLDYSLDLAGVEDGSLAGLRVVLDTFNGSAGPELFAALRRAGAEVLPLRLVPDGSFPTGSPNPASAGKMDAAIRLAQEAGAQVVVGVDGDGDRLVFGSQRGLLTAGFATLAILSAAGLDPGDKVLYDPKVSPLALAEWGRLGVEPVLFRNGHSQIKDYMRTIGATAAAEESGHYYHELGLGDLRIWSENSAYTLLLFLRAVHSDPELLDRLHALQDQVFTTGEFNYQFVDEAQRDAALSALVAMFVAQGAGAVTHTPDGIDLEGIALSRGVRLDPGSVDLAPDWFSGYVRAATNEKGVVRSYFSTGNARLGRALEAAARELLDQRFGGTVVE